MHKLRAALFGGAIACLAAVPNTARAEEIATIQVAMRDHRFIPAEIHVVSGKPTFLEIVNNDPTPEEFESGVLAIEKVIPGGGHARIRLRPLAPGQYTFMGEFHPDTASGVIVSEPGNSPPP